MQNFSQVRASLSEFLVPLLPNTRHPASFYIIFRATNEQALRIKAHGYFTIEIERLDYWSIRFSRPHKSVRDRNLTLRLAAAAWEQAFGPLDQEVVEGFKS